MKGMTRVVGFGAAGIIAVAAGWYVAATSYSSQLNNYLVELKPGDAGVLEVKHENKCKTNGHKGCLLFEAGKVGLIKFYLPGNKYKIEKCSKAENVITKIELTTYVDATKPNAAKGVFTGPFPLPDWLRDDAFSNVKLDSGIVYEAPSLDDARTQVWLVNMNSHEEPDVVKNFWYKVTATACEEEDGIHATWVTDPRGENEGLK
jgi:hypothetical protein